MRLSLQSLGRCTATLALVVALVVGLLPRSGGYRCLAMGTIADAPCCDQHRTDGEQAAPRLIAAACCEHVAGTVSNTPAVREPARSLVATQPLIALTSVALVDLHGAIGLRLDSARRRAGPDEQHRVRTVVLRV
jgi:hypothetical protein